jgi:hypothetical protein
MNTVRLSWPSPRPVMTVVKTLTLGSAVQGGVIDGAEASGDRARQMNRMAGASPTSGSPEGRGAGVLGPRRFYRRPDVDVLAACCRYEDLPRGSEAGTTPPVRVSSIA